jgi:hypothetical protein
VSVQLIEGWEGYSNRVVIEPSGGNGVRMDTTGSPSFTAGPWSRGSYNPGVSQEYLPFKDTSGTRFYGLFRIYLTNYNRSIFGIHNSARAQHWLLRVNASGFLELQNNAGTTVGTGTTLLYASSWNEIEFDVAIGNSAAANVWVHGLSSTDIAVTTQDFQNGSDTTGHGVIIPGNTGNIYDDVIVYDSAGSTNNARVGTKAVVGLHPTAKGDQENWDPRKTSTTQRFYFPKARRQTSSNTSETFDGFPAPVLPAFDALWDYTVGVENDQPPRGRLTPERYAHTDPDTGTNDSRPAYDVSATPADLLGGQYVSPALAAQTISGTAKMRMIIAEETANDNIASQLVVYVVSNDGQTVRGVLYSGDTDTTNPPSNEWSTTHTNRAFPRGATTNFSLSSLAISEGDRLVVEYGGRMRGTARTSVLLSINTGSNGTTDLPEDETDTTQTKLAWIEFSGAISMSDDGNWDHVGIEAPPDDDSTYVSTSTDNDLDLYNLEALPSSLAASGPIVIKTFGKKTDPGARTLTHAYKTSGATQTGSAIGLPTGAYGTQRTYLDVDGTDSAAWSDSKLNALQIGPKATT